MSQASGQGSAVLGGQRNAERRAPHEPRARTVARIAISVVQSAQDGQDVFRAERIILPSATSAGRVSAGVLQDVHAGAPAIDQV